MLLDITIRSFLSPRHGLDGVGHVLHLSAEPSGSAGRTGPRYTVPRTGPPATLTSPHSGQERPPLGSPPKSGRHRGLTRATFMANAMVIDDDSDNQVRERVRAWLKQMGHQVGPASQNAKSQI